MEKTEINIKTTLPVSEVEREVQEILGEESEKIEFNIEMVQKRFPVEQLTLTIIGAVIGGFITPLVDRLLTRVVGPDPKVSSITVVHIDDYKRKEFRLPQEMDSFQKHVEKKNKQEAT